mmetsp:Transcript_19364/g.52101  ORF Transcript_19364/g.52101 Transcript_19364/m.52101 type:complete len:202 (-) Transcript_19364:343-948(-)
MDWDCSKGRTMLMSPMERVAGENAGSASSTRRTQLPSISHRSQQNAPASEAAATGCCCWRSELSDGVRPEEGDELRPGSARWDALPRFASARCGTASCWRACCAAATSWCCCPACWWARTPNMWSCSRDWATCASSASMSTLRRRLCGADGWADGKAEPWGVVMAAPAESRAWSSMWAVAAATCDASTCVPPEPRGEGAMD